MTSSNNICAPAQMDPLKYFSLAAKAGQLFIGADTCIKALAQRKAKCIVLASDASANAVRRAEGMLFGRDVPLCRSPYTKDRLSQACGRGAPVAIAAIGSDSLAQAFLSAVRSLQQQEV